MIQTIDIPELPLATQSMKKIMTTDDLFSMWNVYSKCKHSMENVKRFENLSWRLWHHESSHQQHTPPSTSVKVSPTPTIVPSSVIIISSLSSHSTFGPQTPPGNQTTCSDLIYQHRVLSSDHSDMDHSLPQQQQQQHGRRTNKFYVDDSDESDQEEEENDDDDDDDTFGQSESLWSTVHDNDDHYLEEAYQQRNQQTPPVLSPPPRKENPAVYAAAAAAAAPLDFSPPSPPPATNQKQSCSLLSRLIQSSPPPPTMIDHNQQNDYDILPPQLQSCVDWEKTQNSIRYRLGYSLDLPDENIIW